MSSRKLIVGFLVGLSTAAAACGAQPSSTSPRSNTSGGTSAVGNGGTGTVGAGNTSGSSATSGGMTATGGTGSGLGGSTPIAGTTSTGGTPTVNPGGDVCVPIDSVKALPMAVDGPFIAGGYFADTTISNDVNIMGIHDVACDARPAPLGGAVHFGNCHKNSFLPVMLGTDPMTMMMITYGGVFWLAGSATNWGTGAGANVAPGAQTVKFTAWGAAGGEAVTFGVGGVTGTTCLDNINFGTNGGMKITLTTTPTAYVFNLQGQTYPKGVIGGFYWSTENASTTVPVVFNVDDIRWTADAM